LVTVELRKAIELYNLLSFFFIADRNIYDYGIQSKYIKPLKVYHIEGIKLDKGAFSLAVLRTLLGDVAFSSKEPMALS
jgi:hypothetical protein